MKSLNKFLLLPVLILLVIAACKKVEDLPFYADGTAVTLFFINTTKIFDLVYIGEVRP